MSYILEHALTHTIGLDRFFLCQTERKIAFFPFFLRRCVFLDGTSQCLSIRARNIESLPKSMTANGCNDLAGVGGVEVMWRLVQTQAHTFYLHTRASVEITISLESKTRKSEGFIHIQ